MDQITSYVGELPLPVRLLVFASIALGTHLLVRIVRWLGAHLTTLQSRHSRRGRKVGSLASLLTSTVVFTLYFVSIGFILRELGVSLTAYLASASVIGLAVGFGSQGVVQDVVAGMTFISSDLLDVGDLVKIAGETGIVRSFGMRFIELENALGAKVFVPNRTVTNVINYPRGYLRCITDITLRGAPEAIDAQAATADRLANSIHEQFPGILLTAPSIEGRLKTQSGKEFLRIKFRIWPERGAPIEHTFCKELAYAFRALDPDYQDWMIAVNYEVEAPSARPVVPFSWRLGSKSA